jgi:hypothetical protein
VSDFAYRSTKDGRVFISRGGKDVTVLAGARASRFLDRVEREDPQLEMARETGNYKRGNER